MASISQMMPKLIRSASLGHAGMDFATPRFSDIVTLLDLRPRRDRCLRPACARDTPRGQGLPAGHAEVLCHERSGPKALPPTGICEPSLSQGRHRRTRTGEMVAMMFWYGSHWAFWQAGLMWAGMIVFWGLLIWGIYTLVSNPNRRRGGSADAGDARGILDE